MKDLYIIGGTMGVGKTASCQALKERLDACVFLDGDWCWDMHPFQVTADTKQMVVENICFLLNSFIRYPAYQNIVFCWVLHRQAIIDEILSRVDTSSCHVHLVSLICSEAALKQRLKTDITAGKRAPDIIGRSVARLPLYDELKTYKLDVSALSPGQAADAVIRSC